MAYGGEDCAAGNSANLQIRSGYWDMLSLLKLLAEAKDYWPTLFRDNLSRALASRRRFSRPRAVGGVSWITTDATPHVAGDADWRDRAP